MVTGGAAWSRFRVFSETQRQTFHKILKMNPEKTDELLNRVETLIPNYVVDTTIMYESPPESSDQTKNLLTKISRLSKDLHEALYMIDGENSEIRLETKQVKFPHGDFDMGLLKDYLSYLHAVAHGAAEMRSERDAGRPADLVNYRFIWSCISIFNDIFGKMPKFSKGTRFQNFLKAVSCEVCRPGCALTGNITKRIDAAISHYGP